MYGYVYCIHNKVNGKLYVGQTKRSPEWRWKTHVSASRKKASRNHFHHAIRMHGVESFEVLTLAQAGSTQELNELERLWILVLGSFDHAAGYNSTYGGERGRYTPETRARISSALKGRKPHPNTIAASVAAHKGVRSPLRGVKRVLITKQEARKKGRPQSGWAMTTEQKKKISAAHQGKKYSAERIEQMRKTTLAIRKRNCEHCGMQCPPGTFARWHGAKCRRAPSLQQ